MKKVLRSLLVASLCFIGVAIANAQNHYTFGDGGKTETSTLITSDNISVRQINDQMVSLSHVTKPIHPTKSNAQTHTLTINVNDGLQCFKIHVASGDDYYNFCEDWSGNMSSFSDVVEEGYYDIMVFGICEDNTQGIITYDSIPVFEDVVFEASFNDCIYSIGVNALDEDGLPFSNENAIDNLYLLWYLWLDGLADQGFSVEAISEYVTDIPNIRISGFDERSYLTLVTTFHENNQRVYNIIFPSLQGGTDNIVFENEPGELIRHQEKFNTNNHVDSYYSLSPYTFYDFHGEMGICGVNFHTRRLEFDDNQPLAIFSNNMIDSPFVLDNKPKVTLYPQITYITAAMFPSLPTVRPLMSVSNLYYNSNRQLVYEPFGKIRDIEGYCSAPMIKNYLEFFPETPAINAFDPEIELSYGERTPMFYYQAYNFKPDNSSSGKYSFSPKLLPIGENGGQDVDYENIVATISYNGEQIFNDSLYKWPAWEEYQNENAGFVAMTFNNQHFMVDGVEKYSTAYINFDFHNEDINAPTLTILQVKDENGRESLELPNIASSCINFAAGDFSPHYTEEGGYGHYDYMQYDGKPFTVLVVYSNSTDEEWLPLQYVEEESMFHESYGNYFTIDLSQLRDEDADKWISLQFILVDEAGNFYTNILSNVFYVGHLESVNEHIANSLLHTVYPNPFNGEVRITATQAVNGAANIVVYNVLGEQVYSKAENCTETQDFTIDGSAWKPGVYFYSINTEDGVLQGKIVKE